MDLHIYFDRKIPNAGRKPHKQMPQRQNPQETNANLTWVFGAFVFSAFVHGASVRGAFVHEAFVRAPMETHTLWSQDIYSYFCFYILDVDLQPKYIEKLGYCTFFCIAQFGVNLYRSIT